MPEECEPPVTVAARINGTEVARQAYTAPGRALLACPVPASALARRPALVEFSVDKTYTDPATARVQGVLVFSAALREYGQTTAAREIAMAQSRQAYEHVLKQRDLQIPVEKQRELMKLFHSLPIWDSMWFQNVRIIKNPLDLWMLQQIAYESGRTS